MLRILHVLSGDLWAGAEVMACQLLTGLSSGNSCELVAVILNEGQVADELRHQGIRVTVLDESRRSFAGLILGLRKVLRRNRPDIIHSHRYKENILAFIASLSQKGVSLVSTQHGMPEVQGKKPSLKGRLKRGANYSLLSRRFDRLVAVSDEMKQTFVRDMGFVSEKVPVIHNGIELPAWQGRPGPMGGRVIGSCGRLFPVKNFGLLLETAARVAARSPETRFELAGDGPQMERLREQCNQARLDGNFSFLGHVRDMSRFYQGLDIYVSTSVHEGIPMSVLEAMGHGLPVVAPEVGGFPEIVDHGADGFLIPEHDPELFAEACLRLLNDPDLLQSMSMAAREKAETRFSVQRMADGYLRLYRELVAV
jgi:glycosyltransferase involved in cell wall biosynthesis